LLWCNDVYARSLKTDIDVPTILLVTDTLENTLYPAFQRLANVVHVYVDVWLDRLASLKRLIVRAATKRAMPRGLRGLVLRAAQVNVERRLKFLYRDVVERGDVDAVVVLDPAFLPVRRTGYLRDAEFILWSMDSHIPRVLEVHASLVLEGFFDRVYAAHSSAVKGFRELGVDAEHLPFGVVSDIFYPRPMRRREFRPVFIGSLTPRRREVLERAEQLLGMSIESYTVMQHSYAELMARKFIVLNIPRRGEVNWRDFEALGTGVLLVREESEEIREFFEPNKHFIAYRGVEDLVAKIKQLMDNREEACRVAVAGCRAAWERHLLEDRVCRIVEDLGYRCRGVLEDLRRLHLSRCDKLCDKR